MSLERITAQVDHMREDMQEIKADVKSLLATKHRALGWAAGVGAVVSVIISVLLSGCARDDAPNYADAWWHRTPTIEIDGTMPPECVEAALAGVDLWLGLGVDAYVRETGRISDAVLSSPTTGKISLTYRANLSDVWVVSAETVGAARSRDVLRRIRACAAAAQACEAVIFAHELGHCLGLNHSPEPGWLMSANAGGHPEWFENVSDEEIEWVTQQ